jgi:predicted transposase YdaD
MSYQSHDLPLKISLKQKRVAIDFLRTHLDPEIFKQIDCDTLEPIIEKSFVPPDLKEIYSDLLYRCQFQQKFSYIYFLFEHNPNPTPEKFAAFYSQYFVMKLMYDCIQQGAKYLPVVLPLYLYLGSQSPYPYSQDVHDCFEHPLLARELVRKNLKTKPMKMKPINTQ